MQRVLRHVGIPALFPLLFFAVAATPVEVIGCANRGLAALLIALVSVIAGLVAALKARKAAERRDGQAAWWAASALFLAVPAVALIILA